MSNLKNFLFTSESVSEGHPDKVSDRISDMVVDTYLSTIHIREWHVKLLQLLIRLY